MQSFQTTCKDCIFAIYDNKTQTGCKMGRLDAYKKVDVEIIEAYDEDKEFYVINNRLCNYCRNSEWGSKVDKHLWTTIVKLQAKLTYFTIIFANDSLYDIENTINSLIKQDIAPKAIAVIKYPSSIKASKITSLLNKTGIKWRLENIVDNELTKNKAVDIAVNNFKSLPYYAVFNAGFEVPTNMFSDIDNAINVDMLTFGMLTPNSQENGKFVPTGIHRALQGNFETTLEEKLIESETPCYPITSIVQNFPW